MSLFRKHKKFEEQLNEQLGDMEVKPSASLWDRIDSGITSDSFESGVQNSLENFEQMPYPETWDKIAAELPEPKLGNGLIKYSIIAALAVLFSIGVYIGQTWQSGSTLTAQQESSEQRSISAEATYSEQLASKETSPSVAASNDHKETSSPLQERSVPIKKEIGKASPAESKPAIQKVHGQTSTPSVRRSSIPKEVNAANGQTKKFPENGHINQTAVEPASIENKTVIETKNSETIVAKQNGQTGNNPLVDNNAAREEPPIVPAAPNPEIQQTEAVTMAPAALNQSRELSEAKPDSALYAQKVQSFNEQPEEEELTRFSISVLAGAHLSFTTYGAPKQSSGLNFEKNIALRKELERPDIDWAGGFLVDYRLNNKWMLSSGVAMVNFSQKFEYNIEKALDPNVKNEAGVPTTNPNDSFVAGNQYSNRIKYSWTEVPLYINYTIVQKNKWNIDMQAGVSYAFINTVDGGMIGYDNKGVLVLKGEESFPNIQSTVFVTAMPQVSYQFSPSVSVGIVPTVKYSLTSIIGNEYWIQQHPYFIGMNICLRKRF